MNPTYPAPGSVELSVLIPVKNEQQNMADCLASVAWASEIVVIDSSSTDGTVPIATAAGARIVQFSYVPGGPRKKNWALQNLTFRNQWILILDADERITADVLIGADGLARAIRFIQPMESTTGIQPEK